MNTNNLVCRASWRSWKPQLSGTFHSTKLVRRLHELFFSVLTERMNLVTDPALYQHEGVRLRAYIAPRELIAARTGRFDYGKLEYPYALPILPPDRATRTNSFPPGRFHQDTFSGNANITAFYLKTLVPLLNSTTSFYYHLDNSTQNDDAALNLDATLLGLLSRRCAHLSRALRENHGDRRPLSMCIQCPYRHGRSRDEIRVQCNWIHAVDSRQGCRDHSRPSHEYYAGSWCSCPGLRRCKRVLRRVGSVRCSRTEYVPRHAASSRRSAVQRAH